VQSQPAPTRTGGRPPGAVGARGRREKLTAAYVEACGGAGRVSAIQMEDIQRAVDLVMLAREMRGQVRQGLAKVSHLTTLEGAADRAVRRLNLPAPDTAVPMMDLHDHAAKRAAERAKAQSAEEAE
jgi:hypothetical protein